MSPAFSLTSYRLLTTAIANSVFGIAVLWGGATNAQIVPDATLGAESSRVQSINAIFDRIEGGAQRGSALFHSFREFSVLEGHSAYFASPAAINTIFSRVTGANISNILGTLGVDGAADLVFINPNGVVFGPNARLDIPGSFFVTTANQVQFPDGSVFSTVNPAAPPLLTIDVPVPVGLVFAGDSSGRIYNQADLAVGGDLSFQAGEIVSSGSLIAAGQINLTTLASKGTDSGDIVITGSTDSPSLLANTATLNASNNVTLTETAIGSQGDLNITAENTVIMRDSVTNPLQVVAGQDLAITGKQGVDIFALNHSQSGLVSGRDMVLRAPNTVGGDAHFWSGGSFRIENLAGDLGNLESPHDPIIYSLGDVSLNSYTGRSLHIIAGGSVQLAGIIRILASDPTEGIQEEIQLSNSEIIQIDGTREPTLDVRAGVDSNYIPTPTISNSLQSLITDNNYIPTSADIKIDDVVIYDQFNFSGGKVLITNQYFKNSRLSGDITVNSIDARDYYAGANIFIDSRGNSTIQYGLNTSAYPYLGQYLGGGGDIQLLAKGDINLAGNLQTLGLSGGDIALTSGGNITTKQAIVTRASSGDSGNIFINAQGDISLNTVNSTLDSSISRFATGRAGDISLEGKNISLTSGASIKTSNSGLGNSGDVSLIAQQSVMLRDGLLSGINTNTGAFQAVGDPSANSGDITIQSQALEISNGFALDTSHFGILGNAGNITLTISDKTELSGVGSGIFSTVGTSLKSGNGNSGNITIQTGSLTVEDNARLGSNLVGEGNAGDVDVRANQNIIFKNGRVNTSVNGSGQGGNILLTATGSLTVEDNARLESNLVGEGNAGNVEVRANQTLIFDNVRINTSVAGAGQAGSMLLTAGDFIDSQSSLFNASLTGIGTGGTIQLQTQGNIVFDRTRLSNTINRDSVGDSGLLSFTAKNITLKNQTLVSSSTFGEGNAGNININATGGVLINNRTSLSSGNRQATAIGDGGDITITANNLTFDQSGIIATDTFGQGDAGKITLNVNQVLTLNDSAILATVNDGSSGNSQGIEIQAQRINLSDQSIIASRTETDGNAGDIRITARDNIRLQNSFITSDVDGGRGDGGNISIVTPHLNLSTESSVQSLTAGQGNAGNLKIDVDSVILTDQSAILANTINAGNAGNIEIIARESLSQNFSDIQVSASIDTINNIIPTGNSGEIQITSPTINLVNNSGIYSFTEGEGNAGNIQIADNQQLSLNQSFISAAINPTGQSSQPSNIIVDTQRLNLQNQSVISTSTEGIGDAGNITVPDAETITINNSQMTASTNTASDAGAITLTAKQAITLDQNSQLSAETSGAGNASDINLTAPQLIVNNGSRISAKTSNAGNSGTVNVSAVDQVQLGQNSNLTVETSGSGAPGDINLTTETLTLGDNAQLSATATATSTNTEGGGSINLNADRLNISGQLGIFAETNSVTPAGNLTINPRTSNDLAINFRNNGFISASTTSAGDGGNITLKAPNTLTLDGQGKVSVTTSGSGNAGTIAMGAKNITLDNGIEISASTTGTGQGGEINVNGDRLDIQSGSQVRTSTSSAGQAGSINIQLTDALIIDGPGSGIFADGDKQATGDSGNIFIDPPLVSLTRGAQISANNQGSGVGGNITLFAGDLVLDNAGIFAQTASNQGGNITLAIADRLIFLGNGQISATAGTAQAGGDGGNITINANQIFGDLYGNNQISANAFTGNGGNINISANYLFGFAVGDAPFPISTITASSDFGFDGNIILNIPDLNPLRGVDRLPEQTINVTLQQGCDVGRGQGQAAFFELGKGGIPITLPTFFDAPWNQNFTPIPLNSPQSRTNPRLTSPLTLLPFRLSCQR